MVDAAEREARAAAYELDAVNVRGVLLALAIVIALIAASVFGVDLLTRRLDARPPAPSAIRPPPVAGPALKPAMDLEQLRKENDVKLRTYRWIDRPHGVVQIPIDRAMAIVSERSTQRAPSQ